MMTPKKNKLLFPLGHFYSPIADPSDLRDREEIIWRKNDELFGIDFNSDASLNLLEQIRPNTDTIDYPIEDEGNNRYFYKNDQFPLLDGEFLHLALCHFRPKTLIEVGSGFSSLITAEVNCNFLDEQLNFYCVEPYPRQFLIDGVKGISSLIQQKVENIELEFFDQLTNGDILFIDSSHVSKTGSDVNYLFFEVIPRLKPGVLVHIHDIFLPDEYPKVWMIDEGRNWNEQYLVRAFLQDNANWEITWAANYMATRYAEKVKAVFPRFPELGGGGSLWIRKRDHKSTTERC